MFWYLYRMWCPTLSVRACLFVFAVVVNCRFAIAALCFVAKSSSLVIVVR